MGRLSANDTIETVTIARSQRNHKLRLGRNFQASQPLTRRTSPVRSIPMGSTTDKIKGTANEVIGKAKQGIGEATGSERLQGEGAIQEAKGHGQKALGDAKEAVKDAKEVIKGAGGKQ
jgi:uncharacterized protein YjbJ (UPF0337 family)